MLNIEGLQPAIQTVQYFDCIIQGQVSVGKTWLGASIATEDRPALVLSFDKPAAGLQQHPKYKAGLVTVLDYFDKAPTGGAFPKPTAFNNMTLDLGIIEYKIKNKDIPQPYIILDSLRSFAAAAGRQVMYELPTARAEKKIAGVEMFRPYGYDYYNGEMTYVTSTLARLRQISDFILIAHERPEEDTTSKEVEKRKRLTGKYALDPPRLEAVRADFTNKFRIVALGPGTWRLYTSSNNQFNGACILDNVQAVEEADLARLMAKARGV